MCLHDQHLFSNEILFSKNILKYKTWSLVILFPFLRFKLSLKAVNLRTLMNHVLNATWDQSYSIGK